MESVAGTDTALNYTAVYGPGSLCVDGRNVEYEQSKPKTPTRPPRPPKPQPPVMALIREGKVQFEVTIRPPSDGDLAVPPKVRVGWGLRFARDHTGKDAVLYDTSGTLVVGGGTDGTAFGEKAAVGDVLTVAVDMQKGVVMFARNGVSMGSSQKLPRSMKNKELRPIVAINGASVSVNLGAAITPASGGIDESFLMMQVKTWKRDKAKPWKYSKI
jgi:hypothetical protein